ncbi:hypothetical protein ACQKIE_16025 [Luteibacter sp. NPDC031894]|uniref:hypothetical protein n=1 Tax=Luteibacter sp. NPDC031894 TaxID=3390572 RepID=UPI003D063454
MRQECIQAVRSALGRTPNQGETRDIENRIRLAMRSLAQADPQGWQSLSQGDRLMQAGQKAATEIIAEAAKKRHRTAMAILAHDRMRNYIDSQIASGADDNGVTALTRMLSGRADGKNNITSLEGQIHGITSTASTFLTRSWDVAGGKFLKLIRDKQAEAVLVRALHGDTSVPKEFKAAADDFHEIAERLRQRFNAAGGDIGRLDNWGMPHSWSQANLLQAGQRAWTDTMLPLMDRTKYVHDDGRAYSDPEMRAFLDEAWKSVATGGANKIIGGERIGSGIKANRNSAERQIHLNGPEAYGQAMQVFSERGVFDAMLGHVNRMARDIALIEQFGPNADRQFAQFLEQESAKAVEADPKRLGRVQNQAEFAERLYNYQAGNGAAPPESFHGKAIQTWRNLNVLKLGSTAISSLGDYATIYLTAHVNGIPKFKIFLNEIRALNPLDVAEKRIGESAGLMVREYAQSMSRFGGDVGAHGWSSKLANTFMKVTLLPYLTEARRRAFSYGMMDQVGKAVRDVDSIAKLNDADQRFLKHSGITDADWGVLRLATPENWGGNSTLLTPESIYKIPDSAIAAVTNESPALARDRAASNLMAFVIAEQDRAVIEPGVKTRVRLGADKSADGLGGFIAKSFSLFKSFSFELTAQHMDRALHAFETKRGSTAYMAALIAGSTIMGVIANSIKDLVNGRDPRTLNPSESDGRKNWIAGLTTGGGLGLYGDFLINTYGSRGNTLAETIGGPLVGDASVVLNAAQQAIASSSDPDADVARKLRPVGANAVNALKAYIPGATLFYTRAAMDRLIFNQVADYFSPGYLSRMKARARQQHRTSWWEPDQPTPTRAPNPETIAN